MIKIDFQTEKAQINRAAKIRQIRQCFSEQGRSHGFNGWSSAEISCYLKSIGLENKAVSKFMDQEIDLIYNDLKQARMI